MLDDLKKWVGDGRDLDRDFRDANGATPVGTSVVSNANGKKKTLRKHAHALYSNTSRL